MVELIREVSAQRVRANLEQLREGIAATITDSASNRGGRHTVDLLAAVKYIPASQLGALHEAGVRLVGENRAQDLEQKAAAHEDLFDWHFIGQLQSRRVRQILPLVRMIHSLASESALLELARHRELAAPGMEVLLEVNVAGEPGKAGVAPAQIEHYLEACPFPVAGLMTMPPLTADPEHSRRWFAALRELADDHGLVQLSMGTSQDHLVAVQEGATIVRIGTRLYA